MCGDIKFICSFLGRIGAAAKYPCALCESVKDDLHLSDGVVRTLESIRNDVATYQRNQANVEQGRLNSLPKGYRHLPLLDMHMENVIPCSFHLLHGIGMRIVDELERKAEMAKAKEDFSNFLAQHYISRNPRSKQFTGDAVKTLITWLFEFQF